MTPEELDEELEASNSIESEKNEQLFKVEIAKIGIKHELCQKGFCAKGFCNRRVLS